MPPDSFEEANKTSLEIASKIEEVLRFNGLASLIPIINTMSLSLKLPKQLRRPNSTLTISPKGQGKSTLLIHILARSNPKFFTVLDKNIFESLLLEKPKEYFHNKVLIHDDLISVFGGKTTKQRDQITSFFTQILSDGCYGRDKKSLDGIFCLAHFGIANESFKNHRKALLDSTFLDRFATYSVKLSEQNKLEILEHRDEMISKDIELPKIKLPLSKKKNQVNLILSKDQRVKINNLAMEFDCYNLMSSNRAKNYISIFLLSNALLNGRTETCEYDLQLYEQLHKYHMNSSYELTKENKVLAMIKTNPGMKVEELIKKSGIPKATFYKIRKNLAAKGKL